MQDILQEWGVNKTTVAFIKCLHCAMAIIHAILFNFY